MPTRYQIEFPFEKTVDYKQVKDKAEKKKVTKEVRREFEKRFKSGKNKWFFTKLRF